MNIEKAQKVKGLLDTLTSIEDRMAHIESQKGELLKNNCTLSTGHSSSPGLRDVSISVPKETIPEFLGLIIQFYQYKKIQIMDELNQL